MTVALFILWEVPTVTMVGRVWDAILVTVDALAASRVNCAAKISAVTQIGRLWDAILVVVWWWVASPLPVVWCGPGVGLVGVVPPFPPVEWCAPAFLGLLWVFGILIPMMIMMMMMGTMITIIINSSILMFDWLVVGCLLPTCLVFIALLIVGPLPS